MRTSDARCAIDGEQRHRDDSHTRTDCRRIDCCVNDIDRASVSHHVCYTCNHVIRYNDRAVHRHIYCCDSCAARSSGHDRAVHRHIYCCDSCAARSSGHDRAVHRHIYCCDSCRSSDHDRDVYTVRNDSVRNDHDHCRHIYCSCAVHRHHVRKHTYCDHDHRSAVRRVDNRRLDQTARFVDYTGRGNVLEASTNERLGHSTGNCEICEATLFC